MQKILEIKCFCRIPVSIDVIIAGCDLTLLVP